MIGALVVLLVSLAHAGGWRGDGTSIAIGARPPASWSTTDHVRWATPLPAWGNASPVRAGALVCVVVEPTTLTCLRADDGKVAWTRSLDVIDAFEGAARTELADRIAAAAADERAYAEARAAYSALQRDVRRSGGDPAQASRLAELASTTSSLKAKVDAVAPYRTSAPKSILGYGTPTPTSDGVRVYALTGHGVLAAVDLAGKPVWTRWLGPPVEPMRGYELGVASSPQLVGGVLVVPYGHLRGVDPATGRELWRHDARWDHYGTPAVGTVGGLPVVVTPGGEVVRARDGKVVASGLGQLYYVGPTLVGDVAYLVGNGQDAERELSKPAASAWRLTRDGDGVRAARLWNVALDTRGRFVSSALVAEGRVWAFEENGDTFVLDAATGATVARGPLPVAPNTVMPTATWADGRAFVTSWGGRTWAVRVDGRGGLAVEPRGRLEDTRATPLFEGGRVYVRGFGKLWCVGD